MTTLEFVFALAGIVVIAALLVLAVIFAVNQLYKIPDQLPPAERHAREGVIVWPAVGIVVMGLLFAPLIGVLP